MKFIIFIMLFNFISGCHSDEEKQVCIDNIRTNSSQDSLSCYIVNSLKDTINSYVMQKKRFFPKNVTYYYESIVLFTKDNKRAYSWYYVIDDDKSSFFQEMNPYFAENINNHWELYLPSTTFSFTFDRTKDDKWVLEQIVKKLDKDLYKYLDVGNCKFKDIDEVVNSQFDAYHL